MLPSIDAAAIAAPARPAAFAKLGSYLFTGLGAVGIVADIRNNTFDASGTVIIAALAAYVGM